MLASLPQLFFRGEIWTVLSLGPFPRLLQNTCLESLHLNLYGGSWAPGLLAQVASTQLRVLTIGVPTHARRRNVQHFDCCGVDRALALPQFAGLEHVVFEYDKGAEEEWNSKLCEEILPRFPIARAKSLVQCRGGMSACLCICVNMC